MYAQGISNIVCNCEYQQCADNAEFWVCCPAQADNQGQACGYSRGCAETNLTQGYLFNFRFSQFLSEVSPRKALLFGAQEILDFLVF